MTKNDPRRRSGQILKWRTRVAPLSPDNSEDEGKPFKSQERAQADNANILPLKQSDSCYSFSLGSAPGSYLILSHEPDPNPELCWINSEHCRICPDPDSEAFLIINSSTSKCFVQSRQGGGRREIAKGAGGESVGRGEWELHLGQGLDFLLEVLPRKQAAWLQSYRRLGQRKSLPPKPQAKITCNPF